MLNVSDVRPLYQDADAVHDFDHVLRVARLAQAIGRAEGADLAIVHDAALLHDLDRADAQAIGADHAGVASERAREILDGYPQAHIEAVVHAIASHRFRTDPMPNTLEARVLFDADKLDAIGAIGVARAFAYGGAHGQRLWAPFPSVDVDAWDKHGDDPKIHTPVHEFVVKLSRIKDRMYTPTGRRIAAARHQAMSAFFARLDREVRGEA